MLISTNLHMWVQGMWWGFIGLDFGESFHRLGGWKTWATVEVIIITSDFATIET